MPGHEDYDADHELDHAQYEALLEKGFEPELAEQIARTPGQDEGKKYEIRTDYENWTKEELQDKARRTAVQEYRKMSRSELIDEFRKNKPQK